MFARRSFGAGLAAPLLISAALLACQPANIDSEQGEPGDRPSSNGPAAAPAGDPPSSPPIIEVVTTDYAFSAPSTFPSGWVTLRMRNDAEQPHFVVLWRLPEDKHFEDYNDEISMPFGSLYKEYRAGSLDQDAFFEQLLAALPDWFPVESRGGLGLTSPGRTSQTTVYLEPGEYVMECYVRAPEPEGDTFHTELGMLRPLIVAPESSGASPPEADVRITLSNYEILVEGDISAGLQTVAVYVAEEPEGLIGHDINLVRLDGETAIEEIAAWMSWVDALQPPAPAEFLGGAEQVSAGHTTYFTVTLEPGRYAWISEGYGPQGMFEEFTIE